MDFKRKLLAATAIFLIGTGTNVLAQEAGGWITDPIGSCEVWSTTKPGADEGVSWSGACADGKASGRGTLVWWDKKGLGGRYTGDMIGGKFDGEGRLFVRDDEIGGFNQFLGRFAAGKPVGKGFLTTAKGEHFYGELVDGIRHTKGVAVTSKGWIVKGEFKDGKGVGKLVVDYSTEEGERYVGQAENGKRHGFGILTATDKDFYAGGFANGDPDGPGLYKGMAGDRFLGEYAKGKPNGFGTSIDAKGNVVQGRFVNGDPEGKVLVTTPEGTQSVTTAKKGSSK